MKTLEGILCVRNGDEFDYCWRESIDSLLPVCDRVVVCVGTGGKDDTEKKVREWALTEPKIALCMYPWPDPRADIGFWTTWLNFAREHCHSDNIFQLDADEVLHENSYPEIEKWRREGSRFSLWCERANFYKDSRNLIPPGVCCSHRVVRFLPQNVWLPSDGPDPRGSEAIGMARESGIFIGHYGFLRKPEQYFKKSRALHEYFFNSYDPRLKKAESISGNWMEKIEDVEWINRLVPFTRTHPKLIHNWLKERHYDSF